MSGHDSGTVARPFGASTDPLIQQGGSIGERLTE
jgi:hypothetical protein